MTMLGYKIRIIGNASITRYDNGEGTIESIIDSYDQLPDDRSEVVAYTRKYRPDIIFP